MALLLLVVIGLASAASLQVALGQEKAVNSLRLEALAQQYAELALKYCEKQLTLGPSQREPSLQSIDTATPVAVDAGDWRKKEAWTGGTARYLPLPASALGSVDSSFTPDRPQCLAERVALDDGNTAYLVTARGFSPGFEEDADGHAKSGAVVWLQSLLAID